MIHPATLPRLGLGFAGGLLALGLLAPTAPAGGDAGDHPTRLTSAAIDTAIDAQIAAEGLTASDRCSDADFIRRVSLDLTGSIPSFETTEAFLTDANADKRARLVNELLAGPDFAEYWAMVFERAFVGRPAAQQRFNRPNFRRFLQEAIAAGTPYDAMVRTMLTATGDTREVGAVGFGLRYDGKPADLAGAASRALLGVQIQCAQCHHHPYEQWTTDDFRDFSAYFGRVAAVPVREPDPTDPQKQRTVGYALIDADTGSAEGYGNMGRLMGGLDRYAKLKNNPRARERMEKRLAELKAKNPEAAERLAYATAAPRPLGATTPADLGDRSRRQAFADWLTAPSNPYFARALVNRVWGELFGRAFVNPVDDFSPRNPASHPVLLDRLAAEFQASGYDLRALLRLITATRAYQRSSVPSVDNLGDEACFARAYVRPLAAEQVLNGVFDATALLDGRPMLARRRAFVERIRDRILQQFILTFDNDEGDAADAFEGSVPQALLMLNGEYTNSAKDNAFGGGLKPTPNSTIGRILLGPGDADAKLRRIYLAVLVREPSATELARCRAYLAESGGGIPAFQDIFWALLNSTEFIVAR